MMVLHTPDEMRAWSLRQRCAGKSIGLVPSMGALHEGHASLVRASVAENDVTVVSIFVNPAQFAPHEDFDKYPRTFDADVQLVEGIGASAVYAPTARTMYPSGYQTYVEVMRLTEHLCGKSRPHFFRGVATVVTKLFVAVLPHRAYFGQKDAQQYAVIKRMTRDLDLGIDVIEKAIVREPDGLAMSSRNRYLSPGEHQRALSLSRALRKAQAMLESGERDVGKLLETVRNEMAEVDIDYVELVDAEDIQPVHEIRRTILLAVAARVGETRLIDNIKFTVAD
jgi:pantoate--beta-alanine ligase